MKKDKEFLVSQATIILHDFENLFPGQEQIQMKVGDKLTFSLFDDDNDNGGKRFDLASCRLAEFIKHYVTQENIPVFQILAENERDIAGFMVKSESGFLLFQDKTTIRPISHMLIAKEMPTFTSLKVGMDEPIPRLKFLDGFYQMFSGALLEIPAKEITESIYVGVDYTPAE